VTRHDLVDALLAAADGAYVLRPGWEGDNTNALEKACDSLGLNYARVFEATRPVVLGAIADLKELGRSFATDDAYPWGSGELTPAIEAYIEAAYRLLESP